MVDETSEGDTSGSLDEPTRWGPQWLRRSHLVISVLTLLAGAMLALVSFGRTLAPVADAPQKADSAMSVARQSLNVARQVDQKLDNLAEEVEQTNRSFRIFACRGPVEIGPIGRGELNCSQIQAQRDSTMSRADHSGESAAPLSIHLAEPAYANAPMRLCPGTWREALSVIYRLSQPGRSGSPCVSRPE